MKKNGIRVRVRKERQGEQVFKAIINHPMETGRRRDKKTGQNIPADYIEDVKISIDGEIYIEMVLGENVSKHPFLSFTFTKPLVENQLMQISWVDNQKRDISYECVVNFDQDGSFNFNGDKNGPEIHHLVPEAGPACKTKSPVTGH